MLLKLTLAYDGTGFHGWARQPAKRTVEGVLAGALASVYDSLGPLAVAGRTDAGVHALANVVSVEAGAGPPPDRAARALNALLPDDIVVLAVARAPAGFHARFSARSRSYRYRIWAHALPSPFEAARSLWHPAPIDLERLRACAGVLLGEHDFRAFTPTDTQHQVFVRRVLAAGWSDRGDTIEFEITADSFLRHMVRTLVGTMLEREPDELAALVAGAPRAAAGSTAPAHGLYLFEVVYAEPGDGGTAGIRGAAG